VVDSTVGSRARLLIFEGPDQSHAPPHLFVQSTDDSFAVTVQLFLLTTGGCTGLIAGAGVFGVSLFTGLANKDQPGEFKPRRTRRALQMYRDHFSAEVTSAL
jgi:hypothetical protein